VSEYARTKNSGAASWTDGRFGRRFRAAPLPALWCERKKFVNLLQRSDQNLVHLVSPVLGVNFYFADDCWSCVTPFEIALLGPARETLLRLSASFESVTAPLLGLSRDLWRTLTVCLFTFGSVFELALSCF
jgi:hypothetical protein